MAEGEGKGGAVVADRDGVALERSEAPGVREGQLKLGERSVAERDLPAADRMKGESMGNAL